MGIRRDSDCRDWMGLGKVVIKGKANRRIRGIREKRKNEPTSSKEIREVHQPSSRGGNG